MMKKCFYIFFFCAAALFGAEVDTYGKQYNFVGILQKIDSSELGIFSNQGYPDIATVIHLDKPIIKLSLPVIPWNTMIDNSGVIRLIVHFASEDQKNAVNSGDRVEIVGSIWYADWLSETNPLLLIVDEILLIR